MGTFGTTVDVRRAIVAADPYSWLPLAVDLGPYEKFVQFVMMWS